VLQGLGLFVAVLAAFVFASRWGHPPEDARAIAFTALVAGNLALIWGNRSALNTVLETRGTRNPALWLVTLGTITTLLVILYVPYVRGIFEFSVLHTNDLVVAFALGFMSITWFEALKRIHRRIGDQMPVTREP
jgi:P-type Ca2+ transporter type 2C